MELLDPWDGRDAPDTGDLGIRVRTIHEVVVEGVAGAAPSGGPDQRLVRVRERRVHGVGDGVGLLPDEGVYHPPPEALQREAEAEDYVVRVPVAHSEPPGLRTRRASFSQRTFQT